MESNTITVRERQIPLKAHEVRAILEGRMTQFRRVVKWNNHAGVNLAFSGLSLDSSGPGRAELYSRDGDARWQERANAKCPYGVPGDRLWVKETFALWRNTSYEYPLEWEMIEDRAVVALELYGRHAINIAYRADGDDSDNWRSCIHMPRWASRITLEITDVRVQWAREISASDCFAEAVQSIPAIPNDPRIDFDALWDYAKLCREWAKNPWVWTVAFKRIT